MSRVSHRRTLAAAVAAITLVIAPAAARAQQVQVTLGADRTSCELGEAVQLTVRVDAVGASRLMLRPQLDALPGFSVRSQQTMQSGGGLGAGMSVTSTTTLLLVAQEPGRHVIGPARIEVNGRTFVSPPITIDVGGPTTPQPQQPQGPGVDGAIFDDRAFVRTVVDVSEPVVGQQVTVTIYLYVREGIGLRDNPQPIQEPAAQGFWTHDLLAPSRPAQATRQLWNGIPFQAYVLRRFAAFPLQPGTHTITPMRLRIPIGTMWDQLSGRPPETLEATGVPVELTVRDLPAAGRPAGDVHVGGLALEASLDRAQVPTGDAVTLTLRARATGMIQSIPVESPRVDGLRVLAPQTEDQVSAPGDLVGGERTFEWLIVPEREGTFTIPAFRVPTFDVASGRYGVAESQPITLTAAGNPVAAPVAGAEPSASDAQGDEAEQQALFGPVRHTSAFARRSTRVVDAPWYPLALAFPPVAWVAIVLFGSWRRRAAARAEADVAGRASREARKRLASAESAKKAGDARAFYAAVSLALKSVIEGRLGESVGSLTHPQLRKRMLERGMAEELARAVVDELEAIEFARFSATGAEPDEMDLQLGRARDLLAKLDRFVPTPLEDG